MRFLCSFHLKLLQKWAFKYYNGEISPEPPWLFLTPKTEIVIEGLTIIPTVHHSCIHRQTQLYATEQEKHLINLNAFGVFQRHESCFRISVSVLECLLFHTDTFMSGSHSKKWFGNLAGFVSQKLKLKKVELQTAIVYIIQRKTSGRINIFYCLNCAVNLKMTGVLYWKKQKQLVSVESTPDAGVIGSTSFQWWNIRHR